MGNRMNDGRRKMPKSFCPYCMGRVVDSQNTIIKNAMKLVEKESPNADYIIICPRCKEAIGICIKAWHEKTIEENVS